MGSQASVNTNDKEQQLKKASKMSLIRSLLPIVGLVVIFLLFNFLTDFRMMGNMSLVLSQVYVTMISAMGVFFIMTMGGLDFSQGSILGISSIVVCMLSLIHISEPTRRTPISYAVFCLKKKKFKKKKQTTRCKL